MDTIGIEAPRDGKRVDVRLAAAAVAVTAAIALGFGYALANVSDSPARPATVIARSAPATWQDAVDEANAIKRHTAEAGREHQLDIRIRRLEP